MLLLANVQTLKIEEADSYCHSLNRDTKYVFLDVFIDKNGILAVYINYIKLAKEPTQELVKQILRQHIEKNNNYIASKNMRFNR